MNHYYQVRALRLSTSTVVRQLFHLQVSKQSGGVHVAKQMFLDRGSFGPDWEIISEAVPRDFFDLMAVRMPGEVIRG